MKKRMKFILPLVLIVAGILVASGMVRSRRPAETRAAINAAPLVRVMEITRQDHQFTVSTQGTVTPRTEIALVAEVAGRVEKVSSSLVAGGFFRRGDVLVTLESIDYEAALVQARAQLHQRQLRLAQENAQAEVAAREWERLQEGEASPLAGRELQVAEAKSAAEAADIAVRQAEKNLDRTRVRAPFDGRVREENVDVGQYVARGSVLGHIYAVDYAEVRLPISGDEAAFVDLPLRYREGTEEYGQPPVFLRAEFGGESHVWEGRIVRTEGEIDPRTRLLYTVARIEDPYARSGEPGRLPLAVGLFVEATIVGRAVENVVVLPRSALRDRDHVLVVEDGKLYRRRVDVLRLAGEEAILGGGIEAGEQVCLSPVETVMDGMSVRTMVVENPVAPGIAEGEKR